MEQWLATENGALFWRLQCRRWKAHGWLSRLPESSNQIARAAWFWLVLLADGYKQWGCRQRIFPNDEVRCGTSLWKYGHSVQSGNLHESPKWPSPELNSELLFEGDSCSLGSRHALFYPIDRNRICSTTVLSRTPCERRLHISMVMNPEGAIRTRPQNQWRIQSQYGRLRIIQTISFLESGVPTSGRRVFDFLSAKSGCRLARSIGIERWSQIPLSMVPPCLLVQEHARS